MASRVSSAEAAGEIPNISPEDGSLTGFSPPAPFGRHSLSMNNPRSEYMSDSTLEDLEP